VLSALPILQKSMRSTRASQPVRKARRRSGASVRSPGSKPDAAVGRRFVISEMYLSSVWRPTARPYGEVFRVFDFEVSSKCASGEPEIVPSRELESGRRERKSRELPGEFLRVLPMILRSLAVFSLGVTLNRIFQWQYYDFY
jgi:hypothetical protein